MAIQVDPYGPIQVAIAKNFSCAGYIRPIGPSLAVVDINSSNPETPVVL